MPSIIKNNNIGIFGLSKTGISVYKFLKNSANLICDDDSEDNKKIFTKEFGDKNLVNITDPKWKNLDKIVLSPGVPLDHEIVKLATSYRIPITSDIDILFDLNPHSNFIGVTGTNGKSTTSSLIFHILNYNGLNYQIAGNIGMPVLSLNLKKPRYILELSSFQLDLLKNFKANIAVLLNITPDHLDRHKTMESYIKAKKKIFDRMDDQSLAIINIDNKYCYNIYYALKLKNVIPFSICKILDKGISIVKNKFYDNIFGNGSFIVPFNKDLQGDHNKENIAASIAVCLALNIPLPGILEALEKFQGLPHRMKYIGAIKGINFYNDSKATNIDAASKSLKTLNNIYWLAGGILKEQGIESLEPYLTQMKKAYLFGKDKEIFALGLKNKVDYIICENLEEAFNAAFQDAKSDLELIKNILLAPACASYDQFKNFEERGDLFTKLCQKKINEK